MTGVVQSVEGVPGRTTVSARALGRLATAIVADAARVPAPRVDVSLRDEAGLLAADITLPAFVGDPAGGSLMDRGAALRASVTTGMAALAARQVDPVAVRYAGVHRPRGRRVT
ncbi:hypothetical protein [Microbacterium karelineae]|uniref:hypothetical protein n=1 Tax=Microbacterium karelineae TaxID=2654283 RepID=UPI0012EACB99|nr:hypothetical protein [Microbacterium karelineae]